MDAKRCALLIVLASTDKSSLIVAIVYSQASYSPAPRIQFTITTHPMSTLTSLSSAYPSLGSAMGYRCVCYSAHPLAYIQLALPIGRKLRGTSEARSQNASTASTALRGYRSTRLGVIDRPSMPCSKG